MLEETAGYSINGHKRREIIDHIKYRTMIEREDFDSDPNIIDLKNGLLDMNTGAQQITILNICFSSNCLLLTTKRPHVQI